MITHTVVTLNIEVNPEVEAHELAAIRQFVDIEQERIAFDISMVFGLREEEVIVRPYKENIIDRLIRAYERRTHGQHG